MFPAYAAAPAGLQVDTQMEEKTRRLWSNDSLYLFLCCPHVWEQSTYVARLGFRYSQCHGCFLKNLMCWVPFVCVFQNTCAQNIRGLRAANHLLPELASLRNQCRNHVKSQEDTKFFFLSFSFILKHFD